MNDVYETLNKGVPLAAPINIGYNDLIGICSNKKRVERIFTQKFDEYTEFIASLNGPAIDLNIFRTLVVNIHPDTKERYIAYSPSGYLSSLYANLNYQNICNEYDGESKIITDEETLKEIYQGLKDRADNLKKIRKEKVLKREYPMLYKKYSDVMSLQEDIKKINKMTEEANLSPLAKLKINAAFKKQLEETAAASGQTVDELIDYYENMSIETFTNKYSDYLARMIEIIPEVNEYLDNHEIDISGLSTLDKELFELYIANQYLSMAEKIDKDSKQRYLFNVTQYFKEHPDYKNMNLSISIGKMEDGELGIDGKEVKGITITPQTLHQRYAKLLQENPELHAIDFSDLDFSNMTYDEVEEFMDEYIKDLNANWELIPQGESLEKDVMKHIIKSGSNLTEEERIKKQEKLLDLFVEKKEFYDSTDPFYRIKGKNTFNGYIGHIYKNGKVVLDKFYDNSDSAKLAEGQAIYIMNMEDFHRLSNLTKKELIQNELCKRVIHRGDWQSKVTEQITANQKTDAPKVLQKLKESGNITE